MEAEWKSNAAAHPYNLQRVMEELERKYLQNILTQVEWDMERASNMLGISSQSLERKIRKHALQPSQC